MVALKNKIKKLNIIFFSLFNLIKIKFFKKRTPLIVSWKITNRCNLRCGYCHIPLNETDELDTKETIEVITKLKKHGTKVLHLTGGEPLMRDDIIDLLSAAHRCGYYVALSSNGKMLSQKPEVFDYIDELKLSLDGPKYVHDEVRGNGSFNATLEAAAFAVQKKVRVNFFTVITSVNYKYISEICTIAKNYKTFAMFQPATETVLEGTAKNLFTTEINKYRECITELITMKKKGYNIANSVSGLKELYKSPIYSSVYCLEGLLTCRIQANGDLAGCDRVSIDKKILNVKNDGIMKAFNNLPQRYCRECSCAERVELNHLFSLDFNSVMNIFCNV